jgi:hypothetical protein
MMALVTLQEEEERLELAHMLCLASNVLHYALVQQEGWYQALRLLTIQNHEANNSIP